MGKTDVVSARLRQDEPDENNALKVLSRYETAGYSRREILTMALLTLDNVEPVQPQYASQQVLNRLSEVEKILNELKQGGVQIAPPEPTQTSSEIEISPKIIDGIKRRKRKGMSLD